MVPELWLLTYQADPFASPINDKVEAVEPKVDQEAQRVQDEPQHDKAQQDSGSAC